MPPGGWRYSQILDNGNLFPIEAGTYPELESKVFNFRLANVEIIPSGTATRESVRYDIRQFICSRFPQQCCGPLELAVVSPPEPRPGSYTTPISRLDDWFKRLSLAPLEWKGAAEANAAAEICASCPQNVQWRTGCAPCVESVQRRIVRNKGDRSTPFDSKLLSCRCFGHHNELAVWMSNTCSTAKEPPPVNCWNK
jgi:hypothetical protein